MQELANSLEVSRTAISKTFSRAIEKLNRYPEAIQSLHQSLEAQKK
jgi:predicted DNA-binding protein YlxM (UPF0122 family)